MALLLSRRDISERVYACKYLGSRHRSYTRRVLVQKLRFGWVGASQHGCEAQVSFHERQLPYQFYNDGIWPVQ